MRKRVDRGALVCIVGGVEGNHARDKTTTMTNTISTLSVQDLAERIGGMTTNTEAEQFRALAIKAGYSDSRCSDIPDAIWYSLVQEVAS